MTGGGQGGNLEAGADYARARQILDQCNSEILFSQTVEDQTPNTAQTLLYELETSVGLVVQTRDHDTAPGPNGCTKAGRRKEVRHKNQSVEAIRGGINSIKESFT